MPRKLHQAWSVPLPLHLQDYNPEKPAVTVTLGEIGDRGIESRGAIAPIGLTSKK
jgi:hypothetical protein